MIKLNLHCGLNPREDCQNWDIRSEVTKQNATIQYCASYNDIIVQPLTEKANQIIVNEGGLESIIAADVLNIVNKWQSLLTPGGELIIRFDDIYHVANNFIYQKISLADFTRVLRSYNSYYDMYTVRSILNTANMQITTINYQDRLGIIHAIKK